MLAQIKLNWPNIIEFGAGKVQVIKDHLKSIDKAFFLVDPPIKNLVEDLIKDIENGGTKVVVSTDVVPEPPFEALEALLGKVKDFSPQAVVGIGGGSAMDLAKLVAVLFDGKQDMRDVVGIDNVNNRKVKLITVSTTSGTGSEVTPIAILTDKDANLKKGVVSRFLIPDVAIIDPELTLTLPSFITAATGMDAMTHCIEAYTNKNSHPIIDNIALEGVRLIGSSLEKACIDGNDIQARSNLALGSLYGGMCLGPVNTAAVHAMAYPLGGTFKVSHGVSNSVLLPFVMNFNMISCSSRYAEVYKKLSNDSCNCMSEQQMAKMAVKKIREISNSCNIPKSIKELNVPESAIEEMSKSAIAVKRLMDNNPREVGFEDALNIYKKSYLGILDL